MKKQIKYTGIVILSIFLGAVTFLFKSSSAVPVLCYHHVSGNTQDDGNITVNPEVFEQQIKFLSENGYKTIFIDELISIMRSGNIPSKTVCITFDDGYLDNWVYAYPILKKYKVKATIFAAAKFLPDDSLRLNMDDVWSRRSKKEQLPDIASHRAVWKRIPYEPEGRSYDFISWEEARQMEKSGYIRIESHSYNHARIFGYRIENSISFVTPDTQWAYGYTTGYDTRLGIPAYPLSYLLAHQQYHDDLKLRDVCADYVAKNGAEKFFLRDGWKKDLEKVYFDYIAAHTLDESHETKQEKMNRIYDDLYTARQRISEKLGRECRYLAFPWGIFPNTVNDDSVLCAQRAGYSASFLIQREVVYKNSDLYKIGRIGVYNWNTVQFGGFLNIVTRKEVFLFLKKYFFKDSIY